MKAIVCEMCGNSNLIKQDGMYVCEYCGTRYTLEEARKMMIEGTVNVQGTVQVDNSSFIQKSLMNARRAKQKEDWEEAEKYYNMVEQHQPENIEAIFFSAYAKARQHMIEDNFFKREQVCEVLCKSISVIDDYYDITKSRENQTLVWEMSEALFNMFNGNFVFNVKYNGYGQKFDDSAKTYFLFYKISCAFIESVENIIKKDDQLVYKSILFYHERYISQNKGIRTEEKQVHWEKAFLLWNTLKNADPKFNEPSPPKPKGCYVATCVYGSYDCPEVWTLRRFRDFRLAKTRRGRAFIRLYYRISPGLVKRFGHTRWFRRLWKGRLDRMVEKLRKEGFDSTPYYDR